MAPLIHSSHFDAAKMSNVKIQMPNEGFQPFILGLGNESSTPSKAAQRIHYLTFSIAEPRTAAKSSAKHTCDRPGPPPVILFFACF
jgi:hypothetical protein